METLSDENITLRRCIRDLVAISALPAAWIGYDPPRIAESLADVLLSALRADFIYVRVRGHSEEAPIEVTRTKERAAAGQAEEIAAAVAPWLRLNASDPSPSIPNPMGGGTVRLGSTPIGMIYEEEYGALVAGSSRSDFPTETDRLLLSIAANHATILFQRNQAEEALRESERRFRTLFESMDEGYCVIEVIFDGQDNPTDYRFLEVNPQFEKQTGIEDAKGRFMREIAPGHEQHWFDIYGRIALTGETLRFENSAAALGRYYDVCAFRVGPTELRRVGIVFNDITERKRAEETLIERTRLATLSADTGVALNQADTLQQILQSCTEALIRHLGVAFARIWTLDEKEQVLVLQASAGMYTHLDGPHSRIPVGQLKIGLIAQERKPHLTNEVMSDPRVSDHEWAKREGMVAFAGYPLIVEDRLVGVVAMFARKPLTEATLQALASVANSIALGIERKQAEERLKEQTEIVETINRIGQVLSAELDLKKLVQAVTDAATDLTDARFGSFFYNVFTDEGGEYMLYTLSGVPREAFAHFPMPRATDLFGPTFRGEGTVCIDDVEKDPRYGKNSPYYGMPPGHLPVTSYLAVPVISRTGEVLGGLFFGHPEAGVFTERAARIVEGLAAQAAIAMDNATLYQKVQQALAEREELLKREQAARKQAEEASRAKDEFLGMLSHELRTPLNAILGWTTMLTKQKLDEDMFNRATDTIDRNAKLQARLIDDMLDVSRIISGKLRLETQPVDLTTVISAAVDIVRSAADAKEIRLEAVLAYGAGLVLGDPVRIQQIVWNLLTNAIKFTSKGGHVQVQMQRVDSYFEITVSDTGPGIDENFLPYVFDRFRQADSTAARKHGGLGLGLAIVRHLVELHGGTVKADNRAEGHGAVFTVVLPVMAVRKPTGPLAMESERVHSSVSETAAIHSPAALDGLRVMVVEDEADARELLMAMLTQYGAEVKTSSSTGEALEMLEQYKPDVLVSDIGLPGEDGYVLIKKVRALDPERGGRIPAVALTAYARAEDRIRALTAGFQMHVPKPVEPTELVIVIASLSGRNVKS
ncbi:MAG TPA: GAF domain-containing protein [Blastocatellia bacterium]|nr:GAF domain-containing protein [Blastocatellia bacterium]